MRRFIHTLSNQRHSIKSLVFQGLHQQALKASLTFLPDPLLTYQTYALFIKSGIPLDPFLATTLISHFSKLGHFSTALGFLLDTQYPDSVTFNALISGYARFGLSKPVFQFFDELRHLGLKPDVFTLSSLVKGCTNLEENEIAHGVCLRMGFGSGAYLVSGFIENYARAGDVMAAEKCFGECLVEDTVIWTTMVCGYVWNGEYGKSKEVFAEMAFLSMDLNEFSLTGVLGAVFDVREGKQIHGISVKKCLLYGCSIPLNNSFVNMYSRCGNKIDAVKVFDEIYDPDIVSWTERIGAARDGMEALALFRLLLCGDLDVNEYTIINLLSAISSFGMLKSGIQVQAFCMKTGHLLFISVSNSLISMYGQCEQMHAARCVFDGMQARDSVSWNSLIAGYSENGLVSKSFKVLSQMRDLSFEPNFYTLASILEGISYSNSPMQAMQIHSYMIKCGFTLNHSMVSCLMTSYGKCNRIEESKMIFFESDGINSEQLNAMLTIFVHADHHTDALNLFENSRALKLGVDGTTFSIVIKACGVVTDLVQGRSVHSLALKFGFEQDSFVESSIVDMYCKCGRLIDAENTFRITSNNLAVWNAMIMGYAHHGRYDEVFYLFNKMSETEEVKPDEITYLGLLTSCRHAGLVKEANAYLNSMFVVHGVVPTLEHYACMVDLLGRVGLLEDAKRTIDEMPICSDAYMWQILLAACNLHRNVDLGIIAASKLLELQPGNESGYLLLSNLYASAGMWNAAGKLRKEMKENVVQKEPGSSWIQVGRIVHFFFAGDQSHTQCKDIYKVLMKLYGHILVSPRSEQEEVLLIDVCEARI